MKRLLLGMCLASLAATAGGCACCTGSGWTPCPWPGCGWDPGCGWNGGGCGWGGWTGWGCNRPGGCGDMYWGDWCTGDPHCSTCDGCGNWVGPPSPGGGGVPPEVYGHQGPYGQQVASARPQRSQQPQMARTVRQRPPQQQMMRNAPPPQYASGMPRRTNPRAYGGRTTRAPQMAQRGQKPQDYEGAVEYLGTTDRLVTPAEQPTATSVARRGQPTLAEPDSETVRESAPAEVRRTSRRQYVR